MLVNILLLLNTLIHGTNIWIEPSWVSTNLPQPSPNSHYEAQIFSAKGEAESIHVHIVADKDDLNNLSCVFDKMPENFPNPLLYQVLPIQGVPLPQGGMDRSLIFLDILKPFQPFNLLKGQKAVFWITFQTPRTIKTGIYKTELQINVEEKKLKRIPITIEVFDFEIPRTPSLPAISFLDWQILLRTNPQSKLSDDFWKNLFNFVYDKRLHLSLGSYLQNLNTDTFTIPENLWRNYVNYIKEYHSQNIIDITPLLLPPGPLETVRTLSKNEENMINDIRGINNVAMGALFFMPKDTGENDALRRYLSSLSEQLPLVTRIFCGIPLPQFNFFTDIWALPFSSFAPGLMERFAKGLSIADEITFPIKSISSSTTGFIPGSYPPILSSPWQAIDACIYTGWLSYPAEKEGKKEWIEIQLKEKVIGNKIAIIWGPAQIPQSIDILTSRDGIHFLTSSVNWKHISGTLFDPAISYGTFKYNPDFSAIRFEFSRIKKGEFVYIKEIRLNPDEQSKEPRTAPVITPWLWINPEQYPSLRYDSASIEPRIIPWICWNYGFRGIILTPLISWGNIVTRPQNMETFLFQPQDTLQMSTLLYPAKDTYLHSIRLERLRDGLEDFEYLLLLAQKAQSQKIINKECYNYLTMQLEKFVPWNVVQEDFAKELMMKRLSIGYELSNRESPYKHEKKEFSPKKDNGEMVRISPKVQKNFSIRQKTTE
ncbi:MAG: hypothetical protein ACP5KS_09090 [Candidatus Hydrogenedens sp.]